MGLLCVILLFWWFLPVKVAGSSVQFQGSNFRVPIFEFHMEMKGNNFMNDMDQMPH